MRPVAIGSPPPSASDEQFRRWVVSALRTLEQASQTDEAAASAADNIAITGTTTSAYTFDAGAATATDMRNIMATFLTDVRKRGPKG